MKINYVLFAYLFIFLSSFYILKKYRYRAFSAFIISVLLAQLVLNILYPPTADNLSTNIDSGTSLYFFLQVSGLVLFVIYGIIISINDIIPDEYETRERMFAPKVKY